MMTSSNTPSSQAMAASATPLHGSPFPGTPPDLKRLGEVLAIGSFPAPSWTPHELGAILRHQLATPLEVEVAGMEPWQASKLRMVCDADQLLIKSLGDVLNHTHPPVALLVLLKDFAKRLMEHPDGVLPREVAGVIYWTTIAAAQCKCGQRISRLAERQLLEGFAWALAQPWIEPAISDLLRQAASHLQPGVQTP